MPMRAPYTGSESSAGKDAACRGSAAASSPSDAAARSFSSVKDTQVYTCMHLTCLDVLGRTYVLAVA